MNKVLVFTNPQRWNQLKAQFDVDNSLWNARYNTIAEKMVLKYGIKDGTAVLEELPKLTFEEEGIYFVYDQIDETKLKQLLGQCANDEVFALIHTNGVRKESLSDDIIVLHGNHDTEDNHYYFPLFDSLTGVEKYDTEADKIIWIINNIFKVYKEAALELLSECLEPKINLEESNAYLTLCQKEELKPELEAFKKKYDASENYSDYKEDLDRLSNILIG